MRRFVFNRMVDETGVSGTGVVAEGVEFTNGLVVVSWVTKTQGVRSTNNYLSIEDCVKVATHGGKRDLMELVWIDKKSVYSDEDQDKTTREDQS